MKQEEFSLEISRGKVGGLSNNQNSSDTPILALHGWLDNAASFTPVMNFIDRNYWAIDFPGHGNSFHMPPGFHYNFIDYIPFVKDLIDQLQLDSLVLMGHSMGAAVSSLVAALFPDKIKAGIFIDGLGPITQPISALVDQGRKAFHKMSRPDRVKKNDKKRNGYLSFEAAIDARANVGSISRESAKLLCERNLEERDGKFFWKYDRRLKDPSFLRLTEEIVGEYLKKIEMPILLITGKDSTLPYAKIFRNRIGLLQKCTHIDLQGGHHLHMDNAETVAKHINRFLEKY